jgi:predicted transcriptional regulator
VKRVVGWFQVGFIDEAAPSTLWERFGDVGAIGADEYDAYYSGRDTGAAITVAESWALAEPMSLSDLPIDGAPPQSFRYVPRAILDHLRQARSASRGAPTPA